MIAAQRLEREDLAAAQQRRVDGEEGILRRRTNQDDTPFFDIRQQHVLLRSIEAMDLVDEEDRASPGVGQLGPRFLEDLAHILDACGDGVERVKSTLRRLGDDVSESCLSRARWAEKDDRGESVGLQQPSQELPFTQELVLTDEFVQGAGPHACWERLSLAQVLLVGFAKKIDIRLLFFLHGTRLAHELC